MPSEFYHWSIDENRIVITDLCYGEAYFNKCGLDSLFAVVGNSCLFYVNLQMKARQKILVTVSLIDPTAISSFDLFALSLSHMVAQAWSIRPTCQNE